MSSYTRQIIVSSAIAAILVIGIGFGLYYTLPGITGSTASSVETETSVYSYQGGNRTIVATYVSVFDSTMNTPPTTISSSSPSTQTISSIVVSSSRQTTTSTTLASLTSAETATTSLSSSPEGSYTYTPSSPLKVLSVQASVSQGGAGSQTLGFSVTFQNDGNESLYVISGGGSSLNATISSGTAIIKEPPTVRCQIAEAIISVDPGQTQTSNTPGCWSGYTFEVVQPGTVAVQMTLSWTYAGQSGTTEITADFTIN